MPYDLDDGRFQLGDRDFDDEREHGGRSHPWLRRERFSHGAAPAPAPSGRFIGGTWYHEGGFDHGRGMWGVSGEDRLSANEMRGARPREQRGPKNYTRSDESIRDEIWDRMARAEGLDASNIEVQVHEGEVKLIGTVPVRTMKYHAEDLCDAVRGVKEIYDELRVSPPRHLFGDGR